MGYVMEELGLVEDIFQEITWVVCDGSLENLFQEITWVVCDGRLGPDGRLRGSGAVTRGLENLFQENMGYVMEELGPVEDIFQEITWVVCDGRFGPSGRLRDSSDACRTRASDSRPGESLPGDHMGCM